MWRDTDSDYSVGERPLDVYAPEHGIAVRTPLGANRHNGFGVTSVRMAKLRVFQSPTLAARVRSVAFAELSGEKHVTTRGARVSQST
jgi:hypothetical protein